MNLTYGRRWARAGALGLLGVTLVVITSVPTSGIAGGSPSQEDLSSSLSLSLSRLDPGVLGVADPLVVGATVTNSGITSVSDLTVSVAITNDPIEDRALLDPWEQGDLVLTTREVARTPVGGQPEILPSTSVTTGVSVPPDILDFPRKTSGVYGVTVTLESREGPVRTIQTFVSWLDTEPQVFPVSVVVLASGSIERVDALLGVIDQPEIACAVDPTVLSQEATNRLSALDTFLLPANNIDLASLAHADLSGLLDRALMDAHSLTPSTLVSAPWLAVVPDLDQPSIDLATQFEVGMVLSVPALSQGIPTVTGFEGGIPPGVAVPAVPGATGPLVLLPETQLSAAFVAGPPESVTTPARVIAETALLAHDNTSGYPILVVAGSAWAIESDHPSGTLTALSESPWATLTPISTLIEYDYPALIDLPDMVSSATDIPISLLTSADASIRGIEALATAMTDPAALPDSLVSSLLGTLSVERRSDSDARNTAIRSAIAAIDDFRSLVSIPEGSSVNLISSSGKLPVTVTNNLDVEVTVRVILKSRSPILHIDEYPEVVLDPGASQQVLIPVTAVSSGTVRVRVSLENLDGKSLTPVSEFSLRIHAQWGNAFTFALAGGALLLLVAGAFRTIRRGRADTRQGPFVEPDDAEVT